ncbi:hypothetical protein E4T48_07247 [Aureobasidium sp. EXF-10727]|nr:hypothetical protein E4T48_07247 [Aureobasidium sp. EXF-10727]
MSPRQPLEGSSKQEIHRQIGLLSRTLVPTPTIRSIIPVRIRSATKDDYICIGRDFIQLFEVEADARVTHIATESDFDGEIGSANVIGHFDPYESENQESNDNTDGDSNCSESPMGPQMLAFTLIGTPQLFFLTALDAEDGKVTFKGLCVPMPVFVNPPRVHGNAIAVDPYSRAVAVAIGEHKVFVCYANRTELLRSGQQRWNEGFIPVSSSQTIKEVPGTILLMDFLYPPKDDQNRIILLMIVLHDGVVRPVWVEWSNSEKVESAAIGQAPRIFLSGEMPNLLIPLKGNAAFVLATGKGLKIFENILSTSMSTTGLVLDREDPPEHYPPSSYKPLWSRWVRPRREIDYEEEDYIYLISEDGNVYYLVFEQDSPGEGAVVNPVGSLGCHVDSACAPFGKSNQGDILIVHGASSTGCVWMTECRQAPATDSEPRGGMHGFVVSSLSNWSENLDLIAKPTSRRRLPVYSRDSLFAPSGRQPYGNITELRMGLEARIGARIKGHAPFNIVSHAWILPLPEDDVFFMILSCPGQTHVLSLPHSPEHSDFDDIQTVRTVGLDMQHSTLAIAMIAGNCVFQITESAISFSRNAQDSLLVEQWPPGYKAVAAAIENEIPCAAIALRNEGRSELRLLKVDDVDDETVSVSHLGKPIQTEGEVISLAIHTTQMLTFVVAGDSNGTLHIFRVSPRNGLEPYLEHEIPQNPDHLDDLEALSVCESILVLGEQVSSDKPAELVVLCGLRGGSVYALELRVGLDASLHTNSQRHFSLGLTTVNLNSGKSHLSAFATCGDGLFSITMKDARLDAINISDVYLIEGPHYFQQDPVAAMTMVPYHETSTLSEAFIVISGDSCLVTAVSDRRQLVPNHTDVLGSPHTLIESRPLNCLVSASSYVWVRSPGIRAVRDVVQFSSGDWNCTWETDIGWKVHSMTEWSFRRTPDAARHVLIAVAVGRATPFDEVARPGSMNGNIYLLRPPAVGKEGNVQVSQSRQLQFESPVTAIATYSDTQIIVCSGKRVYFLECDVEKLRSVSFMVVVHNVRLSADSFSRFREVCHFVMHSAGIRVTTAPPHIHITTERDSTLTLQLVNSPDDTSKILRNVARGDGARQSTSHTTVDVSQDDQTFSFNLTSTLNGELVGLRVPDPSQPPSIASHDKLFTAKLFRSVMRVVEAKVRPPWKPVHKTSAVLKDDLVGITTDGTVYGFAVLDERITNRLRWVQRLCQRSPEICPFTYSTPPTTTQNGTTKPIPVILPPLGFENPSDATRWSGDMVRKLRRHRPGDMHVDGDILVRLLERDDSVEVLNSILDAEAKKEVHDPISSWVRDNLEAQKAEVKTLIAEARAAVDRWW